jgi:hypothetical protein
MSMYPLASVNANSGAVGSFSFSSIPSTFTHLQLRCFTRATSTNSSAFDLVITVNGANPTAFAYHSLRGDGSSASSSGATSDNVFRFQTVVPSASFTSSVYGCTIIDILDYANTNKNKTARAITGYDSNTTSAPTVGYVGFESSAWFNTTAINSLVLGTFGNFAQYSRVDLYGISTSPATGA